MTEPELNTEPIVIDARSGGQVFRTSIGLSALTGKPVRIERIRSSRPNPGLQPQHLAALKTVQQLCNAKVEGCELKSQNIVFFPQKPVSCQLMVNVGTAGSTALVLQSAFFPSLLAENRLRILGGTNVPFAPPIEFVQKVLLPVLHSMHCRFEVNLNAQGFFPKGKGSVSFSSKAAKLPLKPVYLVELGSLESIECFSSCASLPQEVAERQIKGCKKSLSSLGTDFVPRISCSEKSPSKGSSVVLLARFSSGRILSSSALGKKGVPAEEIGKESAQHLLEKIQLEKAADTHLADQLVPFIALAKGCSTIETGLLSDHCINNIAVCEKLLGVHFEVKGERNKAAEIFVEGIGFKQ